MLVGLYQATSVFSRSVIKRILVEHNLKLTEVDRDRILSNDDARVILDILYLSKPDVRSNITRRESLRGIRIEGSLHQVSAVVTDELGDSVIRV